MEKYENSMNEYRLNYDSWGKEKEDSRNAYFVVKRGFDLVFSLIGLIVLSPFFLFVMLLIRLESKGGVIYSQERMGKDGNIFRIYKFRSMYENAEKMRDQLVDQNTMDGPVFKIPDDPRITKVGKIIRKLSIDELPQLVNVLKGEMSLVGPRPLVTYEAIEIPDYAQKRHSITPGLTCYWQISGRNDINFDEWMQLDLQYLKDVSFKTDIKILLKTVRVVLFGKGAY